MKIHTLNADDDDHRPNLESSDEESGNEGSHPPPRQPQEYYVGGSTTSGQQVIDPHSSPFELFNARLKHRNRPTSGEVLRVNLEMYDDGFTIENSALRPFTDPANIAFIDALKRRETPPELILQHGDRPIDVHCSIVPGKYVFKPFSGAGYRLGGEPSNNSDN